MRAKKERLEHRARGETVKEEIEEEVVQRGGGWQFTVITRGRAGGKQTWEDGRVDGWMCGTSLYIR